jgi:hypothetical protein
MYPIKRENDEHDVVKKGRPTRASSGFGILLDVIGWCFLRWENKVNGCVVAHSPDPLICRTFGCNTISSSPRQTQTSSRTEH